MSPVARGDGVVDALGLRLIGHSDLGGCGDGMQVLRHRDALYVGHTGPSGMGTSILDVVDPRRPRLVAQWPAPPDTHTHKVQVGDGLLLTNEEQFPFGGEPDDGEHRGVVVYSLDEPLAPRRIGAWHCGGRGAHRLVYTGGRYAHLSATPAGFADRVWVVLDLADPSRPVEAARWWWPGQGPGEQPDWQESERYAAHHAMIDGDRAFLGYGHGNLVVLDVADRARPRRIGGARWDGGDTHTCLPLAGRGLVVCTDEQTTPGPGAPERRIRVLDVSDPTAPRSLALVPAPDAEYARRGLRFGPHNLHENRPGSFISDELIFATYQNAGVRAFDIRDPYRPKLTGALIPAAPAKLMDPRPGRPRVIQTADVYVRPDGVVFCTDYNAGLLSAQYER